MIQQLKIQSFLTRYFVSNNVFERKKKSLFCIYKLEVEIEVIKLCQFVEMWKIFKSKPFSRV